MGTYQKLVFYEGVSEHMGDVMTILGHMATDKDLMEKFKSVTLYYLRIELHPIMQCLSSNVLIKIMLDFQAMVCSLGKPLTVINKIIKTSEGN